MIAQNGDLGRIISPHIQNIIIHFRQYLRIICDKIVYLVYSVDKHVNDLNYEIFNFIKYFAYIAKMSSISHLEFKVES